MISLEDLLHERWYLRVEPFFRALDAVPEDQVFAEDLLKEDLWHDKLHIVKGLRDDETRGDVSIVRFQVGQGERHQTSGPGHVDIHHVVLFDSGAAVAFVLLCV